MDEEELEKRRSALRRRAGGYRGEGEKRILGIAITFLVFAAILFVSYSGAKTPKLTPGGVENNAHAQTTTVPTITTKLPAQTPKPSSHPAKSPDPKTPSATTSPPASPPPASDTTILPAPTIRLTSPENTTYNTGTPPLDFIVAGSNLDSVLLSVDGGENITVPHDSSLSSADRPFLSRAYWGDFSTGAIGWTSVEGKWIVDNGRYISQITEDVPVFSVSDYNLNSTHFAIETIIRQVGGISGNGFIIFSYKNPNEFYYAGAYIGRRVVVIGKYDGKLMDKKTTSVEGLVSNADFKLRVEVEGGNVILYLDGMKKVEYDFGTLPAGKAGLVTKGSNTEFDDFSIFIPFSNGIHSLTIFANNTAGNFSSVTVPFSINVTAMIEEEIIGGMRESMSIGGFEVSLDKFTPNFEIVTGTGRNRKSTLYSRVDLAIKNIGDVEVPIKLDPEPVLIDDIGKQYIYVKTNHRDEFKEATLYPGAGISGAVFFTPEVGFSRGNLTLIFYVNGIKYEFRFNQYG